MTLTCLELRQLAENMGIHLQRHDGRKPGYYHHPTRTISTRRGLSIAQYRSTLAHELAHAHYGDHSCNDRRNSMQERRAYRWAAKLLISPIEYALAEKLYGPHPGAIADELEVTRHLIEIWQTTYKKEPAA